MKILQMIQFLDILDNLGLRLVNQDHHEVFLQSLSPLPMESKIHWFWNGSIQLNNLEWKRSFPVTFLAA